MQQGSVLLRGEAAIASESAGWMSVGFGGLNARMASSHAENTNQFISEVCYMYVRGNFKAVQPKVLCFCRRWSIWNIQKGCKRCY